MLCNLISTCLSTTRLIYQKMPPYRRILSKSTSSTYQCSRCGKRLTKRSSLNRHLDSCQNQQEGSHKCLECNEKFTRHDSLTRHHIRFHTAQQYQCSRCSGGYPNKDRWRRHIAKCQVVITNEGLDIPSRTHRAIPSSVETRGDVQMHAQDQHLHCNEPSMHAADTAILDTLRNDISLTSASHSHAIMSHDHQSRLQPAWWLETSLDMDEDAPHNFTNDIDMQAFEQLLDSLTGFNELGRLEIDEWPHDLSFEVRQHFLVRQTLRCSRVDLTVVRTTSIPDRSDTRIARTASWHQDRGRDVFLRGRLQFEHAHWQSTQTRINGDTGM